MSRIPPKSAAQQMRRAGLTPLIEYPGVTAKWRCRCRRCKKIVEPRLDSIRRGQGGCRFCARATAARALRLPRAEAVRLARVAGFEPLEPYRNSVSKWKCRCKTCGNESAPTLGNMKRGHRCKFCDGRTLPLNSATLVELLTKHDLVALEPYRGSLNPWKCKHLTCGAIVRVRIAGLRHQGRGPCDKCGRASGTAKKRHAESRVREVLHAAKMTPIDPLRYSNRSSKLSCICNMCGNSITPQLASLLKGSGCKFCAPYGFDPARSGYLYVLVSGDQKWGKFGITHNLEQRINQHRKNRFFINAAYKSPKLPGTTVVEIEDHLKELTWDQTRCPKTIPGYTESFSAELIRVLVNEIQSQISVKLNSQRTSIDRTQFKAEVRVTKQLRKGGQR